MAHNINTYIGRASAWHQLGTVTGQFMTLDEIMAHGGMVYDVEKRQLEYGGTPVEAWGTFRTDNGAFLGSVGEGYTVVNHVEGFRMLDSLVNAADGAHYETAGVLGRGEVVWGLIDLKQTVAVGDDVSKGYLLFTTSHNGSFAHQYRQTLTRVVCQNTLNVAIRAKTAAMFRVKHTKNAQARIDDAHKALEAIAGETKTIEEKLRFLAERRVTRESLDSIMARLFPKVKDDDGTERVTTRRENIVADILARYEYADGGAFPEQRGTAYNLLNAITEYTDHFRSTKGGQRAESATFGSGDKLKTQALEVILAAADGMPAKVTAYNTVVVPAPAPKIELPTFSPLLESVIAVG